MVSSTVIPVQRAQTSKNTLTLPNPSRNRYSIQEYGQGRRTYSYEFDLYDYEPEEITVLLDNHGTLRIRAYRPPCREFKREYNLGGSSVETTLVRNTLDTQGRLRVDIDVRPKQYDLQSFNTQLITEDLRGYRPEHVTVKINSHGLLKINAQHLDDSLGNHINREFYRQYQLPANVNPDQVRAHMDDNQILTIELPQSSSGKNSAWIPAYERSYPPFYGAGPNGAYCCCNLM